MFLCWQVNGAPKGSTLESAKAQHPKKEDTDKEIEKQERKTQDNETNKQEEAGEKSCTCDKTIVRTEKLVKDPTWEVRQNERCTQTLHTN